MIARGFLGGIAVCLSMAAGSPAIAQQVTGLTILSYGIYRAELTVVKEGSRDSLTSTHARNICHVMTTTVVPNDEERLFGIAYRIDGDPPGGIVEIRRTVRYPDPNGGGSDVYTTVEGASRHRIGALSYGGWGIDERQPPGPWTVNLFHQDRKLAELNFTVTADRSFKVVPDEKSQCFLVSAAEPRSPVRIAGR